MPKALQKEQRSSLIAAVQTPLGFYSLIVLSLEVILGIVLMAPKVNIDLVVGSMATIAVLLILIVTALAYVRPEALSGKPEAAVALGAAIVPSASGPDRIAKPAALCVSTTDFDALGSEKDAVILKKHFRSGVTVKRGATLDEFRALLTTRKFDVLHILCYVEPAHGSLIFPDDSGRLSADGVRALIDVCGARLVVLGVCDSMALAAKVGSKANMIAAYTAAEIDTFVTWADSFYGVLAQGKLLSQAFDIARKTTEAPMVLLLNKELVSGPP